MICCNRKRACLSLLRATLFAALLPSCLPLKVAAQFQFDVWTTDNGLPHITVNALVQTRDGYLWVATNDGLARFDGVRFTIFQQGKHPEIGSNRFTALYEDRQGTLWCGTYEGLLIRYRDGQFLTYTAQHGLPYDELFWIEEDAQGRLWLKGGKTLTCWQGERATVYDPQAYLPGFTPVERHGDRVWWSMDQQGLHLFRAGRRQTYTEQDGLPSHNISSVNPDQHGNVWIGTPDAGLVKLKDHQLTVYPLHKYQEWARRGTGGMAYEDQAGQLWLFMGKGSHPGTWLAQVRDGQVTQYPTVRSMNWTFYQDREGTLWVGTTTGLYRARPLPIRTLVDEASRVDLSHLIYAILPDRAGNVWVGKWGGGVARYRDGRFTHFVGGEVWKKSLAAQPHPNVVFAEGLFGSRVTSLYEDRAGLLWVAMDGGVSQFRNEQFTRFSAQHGLARTWAMHEDEAGNFWFATDSGLTRLRDGQFTVFTTRDGLAHDDVKVILPDRTGALWLGTHGGLSRYAAGRFTTIPALNGCQIRALYEDERGVLWIGTYGSGLFRLQGTTVTRYTTREGLYNDGAFQLLPDARGYFWIGSNLGIYRVRRDELDAVAAGRQKRITSLRFGKEDGMLEIECNGGRQPAGARMRDGTLWIPTQHGVAIVNPDALPPNLIPPPVVIEEFLFDQQPRPFRSGVQLAAGQNHFEVRYTGLSLFKSEHLRFRYRLAGWETDWVEAGTHRTAYYSNVAPGAYTFEVTAANSDGIWNEQAAVLRIVVLPHWYQTWWFKVFVALAVLGLLSRLYLRRQAQVKRKQVAQEKVAQQLIEAHESERKRLASELHDGLNQTLLIINNEALLGELASHDHEASHAKFGAITDAASQAINEVHEIIHSLRPFQLDRFGLYKALLTLLEKVQASSGVQFVAELTDLKSTLTPEEETQVYRIVQEGINNIIQHAQATKARIKLVRDSQQIILTIADNGRGFAIAEFGLQNADSGIKKSEEQSNPKSEIRNPNSRGLGLTGLRERARILGGKIEIHSALGQGTTLTLRFPLTVMVQARKTKKRKTKQPK